MSFFCDKPSNGSHLSEKSTFFAEACKSLFTLVNFLPIFPCPLPLSLLSTCFNHTASGCNSGISALAVSFT